MTVARDSSEEASAMDEETIERLLRLAAPQAAMPDVRAARVRERVHGHWQAVSRARAMRKRRMGALATAAAAAILVVAWLLPTSERGVPEASVVLAVVSRVEGRPLQLASDPGAAPPVELRPEAAIRVDEWIETDRVARVGLRTVDGASLRIDAGSRLRLRSARVIELATGAIYLDSHDLPSGWEVRTPLATARDIGTQFELRVSGEDVRLSVRSGVVELQSERRTERADAGTEVILSKSGAERRRISIDGPRWEWIGQVAPHLELSGRSVSAVLDEIARERGWQLQYASDDLAAEASGFLLHGSFERLTAAEALDVATATSALEYRLDSGRLVIRRRPAVR